MSRIFDALQRSGAEQSGVEYPDMVSVATEVFEAPQRPPVTDRAPADPAPAVESPRPQAVAQFMLPDFLETQTSVSEAPTPSRANPTVAEFPALEVAVTA